MARVLLFADSSHDVMEVDESIVTEDSSTVTGHWESPTLNRVQNDVAIEMTITKLVLLYKDVVSQTTIDVKFSRDGGNNWVESVEVTLEQTSDDEVKRVIVGANADGSGVTGYDLRFKIEIDNDVALTIVGYRPTLIPREVYDDESV